MPLIVGCSCRAKAARDLDGVLFVAAQQQAIIFRLPEPAEFCEAMVAVNRHIVRNDQRTILPAQAVLFAATLVSSVARKWRYRTVVFAPPHVGVGVGAFNMSIAANSLANLPLPSAVLPRFWHQPP